MWRDSVNKGLQRLTGYQVQRASTTAEIISRSQASERRAARLKTRLDAAQERLAERTTRIDQANKKLGQLERRLEKSRARAEKAEGDAKQLQRELNRKPKKEMPTHYDDAAVEILQRVEHRTMTDFGKLFGLVEATRYIVARGIPGDFVECGVWRGGSMQAVALTLIEQGATDRGLHLFDTYEGMPPPSEKDRRSNGETAEEMLATHDRDHRIWAIAGLEDVQEAMQETDYPADRIHYHKGMVEDTVPDLAPEQIALLRLDTDWYESTRHELEHLYERLAPGGVLILDDYGDWEGARLATEEYLSRLPHPLLLLPIGTGRLALKPFE